MDAELGRTICGEEGFLWRSIDLDRNGWEKKQIKRCVQSYLSEVVVEHIEESSRSYLLEVARMEQTKNRRFYLSEVAVEQIENRRSYLPKVVGSRSKTLKKEDLVFLKLQEADQKDIFIFIFPGVAVELEAT
ncbi:Histidine--tRNA ligase [Gossypium australe]|uniref:Histidine--tRNA ligase n=1 Tax=Gossypium australe TaxID=47621 RepID=A0A5B6VY69_9ROSI|nr:Histidine--tRNA ligase [Gossypium australe]